MTMKIVAKSTIFAATLLLAACNEANESANEGTSDEASAVAAAGAAAGPCTQEAMMAKAKSLGEKMQGLASDPAAMQEMAAKMQEIQTKVQQGSADGSFGVDEACAAYDALLAAS